MTSSRREAMVLAAGDLALLVLSLWLALYLRELMPPALPYFYEHVTAFLPVLAASLLVFYIAGLYERQTRLVKRILGIRILGAQAANTFLAAVLFFALPFAIAPKTVLVLYLGVSVALISCWRFFIAPYFSVGRRERAVIVGTGRAVEEAYAEINGNAKYYVAFADRLCQVVP